MSSVHYLDTPGTTSIQFTFNWWKFWTIKLYISWISNFCLQMQIERQNFSIKVRLFHYFLQMRVCVWHLAGIYNAKLHRTSRHGFPQHQKVTFPSVSSPALHSLASQPGDPLTCQVGNPLASQPGDPPQGPEQGPFPCWVGWAGWPIFLIPMTSLNWTRMCWQRYCNTLVRLVWGVCFTMWSTSKRNSSLS